MQDEEEEEKDVFPALSLTSENVPSMEELNCSLDFLLDSVSINRSTQNVIERLRRKTTSTISRRTQAIYDKYRIPPNTEKWVKYRGRYLTASSFAAVLGVNKFSSPEAVFLQKTGQVPRFPGNTATQWGHKYEMEAALGFQYLTREFIVKEPIGLLIHPYIKKDDPFNAKERYAATPDFITFNGALIEVKCPFSRKIQHFVPAYYLPQVQMQLAVTDTDICYFVQYKPPTFFERGVTDIVEVYRDRSWFERVLPVLDAFWDRVLLYHQQVNAPLGSLVYEEPKMALRDGATSFLVAAETKPELLRAKIERTCEFVFSDSFFS